MLYISKGVVCKDSTEQRLLVAHSGKEFVLTRIEATIWINGRFGFAESTEEWALHHLNQMGLVEYEYESTSVSKYRILSRCICCAAVGTKSQFRLTACERTMMTWLTKAGLHLSVAELVFLMDRSICPKEDLLYKENRQALVETIYMKESIYDNALENLMECAVRRDEIVKALQRLIKLKRVVLL